VSVCEAAVPSDKCKRRQCLESVCEAAVPRECV